MSRSAVVRGPVFLSVLFFLTMAAGLSTVSAQELRYSYVEGGWLRADADFLDDEEDGWFGGGQMSFKRLHFFAEYADPGPFEIFQAGGGWHGLFGDNFDLVAEGAYYDVDFDDGYRLSGGIRWLIKSIELNSFYNHINAGDFENDGVSVGVNWEFLDRFAVGGEWEWGDESDSGRLFFRFYFQER